MDTEYGRFDWSKEAVLEMIKIWKIHQCLYNHKNKFYHNRRARNAALNQIAEGLKEFHPAIGAAEIKNKMTYLRGQYTREISKVKERKSGEEVYVPSAYWYNELSFLNDFVHRRKGRSNSYDENSVQPEYCLDESLFLGDTEISPAQPSKRPRRLSCETPESSRTMSQEDSVLTAAMTVLQQITSDIKTAEVNKKDDAFCNYIKAELNGLTNMNIKDELMERITLAVFEAKKKQRMSKDTELKYINFDSS